MLNRLGIIHIMNDQSSSQTGLIQALIAYCIWGFMPLFFKQLEDINSFVVVAHRTVWALILLVIVLAIVKRLPEYYIIFKTPKLLRALMLSSLLIAANWLVYIWSVQNDHILAASLGYYLNPLLNVVLGFFILKERLNRWQLLAVLLALAGVLVLGAGSLETLWISLVLAGSFGCYGLVRKLTPVGSIPGLAAETTMLMPIGICFIIYTHYVGGFNGLGYSGKTDLFLILGGAMTAIPLLFFAAATKKLSYTTLGFIQYIGPSIQLLLAVFLYKEPLTIPYTICFALIWLALGVYSVNGYMVSKKAKSLSLSQP